MNRPLSISCATPLAGPTLTEAEAVALEHVLQAIADRNRLKMLNMLVCAADSAICVCEFMESLDLPQPNVSYHLKQLVKAGIIVGERRGRNSYYSVVDGALSHVAALVGVPATAAAA
jgi:ArsR family transcriptional regulator, arsenate/arsenite/antimonite-responsive transcriptional repressor